jgi:Flp pilus assembly protein TadB
MRYVVALLTAGLVIAAVAAFSWWNRNAAERAVRQHLRQEKERGELPPESRGVDTEAADLRDFNLQVPDHVLAQVAAARLLAASWYVWAPAVVGMSLGVAALIGRRRGRPEPKAPPDRPRD